MPLSKSINHLLGEEKMSEQDKIVLRANVIRAQRETRAILNDLSNFIKSCQEIGVICGQLKEGREALVLYLEKLDDLEKKLTEEINQEEKDRWDKWRKHKEEKARKAAIIRQAYLHCGTKTEEG